MKTKRAKLILEMVFGTTLRDEIRPNIDVKVPFRVIIVSTPSHYHLQISRT